MKRRRGTPSDLHDAFGGLSGQPTPDFTRTIMGRLGYMRVSPTVARRHRIVQWANRAGMLMVVAMAFGLGWRVFESSPQVRRPVETTIPQAVSHDVQIQQQRVGSMIETIRSISLPRLNPPMAESPAAMEMPGRFPVSTRLGIPADDDHQRDAAAARQPKWPMVPPVGFPIGLPSGTSTQPGPGFSDDGGKPLQLPDDVNRTNIAPVRWV